jgi:hypothetical protein
VIASFLFVSSFCYSGRYVREVNIRICGIEQAGYIVRVCCKLRVCGFELGESGVQVDSKRWLLEVDVLFNRRRLGEKTRKG